MVEQLEDGVPLMGVDESIQCRSSLGSGDRAFEGAERFRRCRSQVALFEAPQLLPAQHLAKGPAQHILGRSAKPGREVLASEDDRVIGAVGGDQGAAGLNAARSVDRLQVAADLLAAHGDVSIVG
jgi:hypothetical protein